ncbi:MAG: hypothetical protein A2289_01430 [Deltaproteobacteria bacterium RIFOXYA12_FULL_58_15]|nr:MAG: hypothetical protein A2289_01430 [Deltaproteobacteria bacterium RIFOXYA12_FULL_58_15]
MAVIVGESVLGGFIVGGRALLLLLLVGGCAVQPPIVKPAMGTMASRSMAFDSIAVPPLGADSWSEQVATAARWHLQNRKAGNRRDCSSLVNAILMRAGFAVTGNSKTHWQRAEEEGRVVEVPFPGALVVFDYTYDANANGLVDDELTHIGVVLEVGHDGTVTMVHFGSGRVTELKMNLQEPSIRSRDGRILNDTLRSPSYGPKDGPRLAGQLFHGYVRPPR